MILRHVLPLEMKDLSLGKPKGGAWTFLHLCQRWLQCTDLRMNRWCLDFCLVSLMRWWTASKSMWKGEPGGAGMGSLGDEVGVVVSSSLSVKYAIVRRRWLRGEQRHRRLDGWRKHGLNKGQGGLKEVVPKSVSLGFIKSHWVGHQSRSACRSGCGHWRRLVLVLAILRLVPDPHALVLVVMGAPVRSHISLHTLDLDGLLDSLLFVWILELPFSIVRLLAIPGLAIAGGLVWSARSGWSALLRSLILLRLEGLELSLVS